MKIYVYELEKSVDLIQRSGDFYLFTINDAYATCHVLDAELVH